MEADRILGFYRRLYAGLLRLYPRPFRRRFAESMEQTFHDLCRDHQNDRVGLLALVLGLFVETSAGILRERARRIMPSPKTVVRPAIVTAGILLVPLVAMRFTDEVDWSVLDFVVMGSLVFGVGLAFEWIAGRPRSSAYRAATGLGLLTGFLLVWINLAVGVIGSEDNPANVLYLGVLTVGALGAAIARLRPRGMARALFATALVQALVPLVAMSIWRPLLHGETSATDLFRVLLLNASFAILFVGSGALFRLASASRSTERPQPSGGG